MAKKKGDCDLSSCFMCRFCVKEWLPAIAAHRENIHYKTGESLFQEGGPVTGIYFIYRGTVKVHKQWGKEKELIVRFAQKGDIVGHRGLGGEPIYPVSATALTPVTVCYIDLDFFYASLKSNHEFIVQLMLFFANELKESEENMRNLAHMTVKGRIALALLMMQNKFGLTVEGDIDFPIRRQYLASFAGTTYETVFRFMNEFVQEQIIRVDGKSMSVLDLEKLLSYTKHSDSPS